MAMGAWLHPTIWKRGTGPGGNHGDHCGLDREGQPYQRALDDDQPGVPPTNDFGGPLGRGVLSAKAESNTAVHVV